MAGDYKDLSSFFMRSEEARLEVLYSQDSVDQTANQKETE